MQIITNNAGKELKKHGDNAFPFLVSYERLSGYETGSFLSSEKYKRTSCELCRRNKR